MLKRLLLIFLMVAAGLLLRIPALQAAIGMTANLEPNLISIGASYNGTHISLNGEIPRNAEVLVRLTGATKDDAFLKKGRVLGLLWMNTGKVTFHHIPQIYLLYSPSAIKAADLAENSRWQDLGIGFSALKAQTEITPESEDLDQQFKEFLKFKMEEGLYGIHENTVTYQDRSGGKKFFNCELEIPSAVPPGSYTVTAFVLQNEKVIKTIDNQLKIEETGLPALIGSLAFNHSIMYGILAILFAVFAGLLMSVLFKQGGEAH